MRLWIILSFVLRFVGVPRWLRRLALPAITGYLTVYGYDSGAIVEWFAR